MSLIHIVFSSDDNYVVPTGVAMQSVLANRNPSTAIHFHIMLYQVSDENHRLLKSFAGPNVDVSLIDVTEEEFPNCCVKEGVFWTLPVWFRLRYASFFPELDKILALDSDMVIREDLTPLWETDVSNVYVAAVPSGQNPDDVSRYLGLPRICGVCFNPATSLMNLKKFREDGIEKKSFDFLNQHLERLRYNEEDILNNVLQDKRLPLDPRWNMMPHDLYDRVGYESFQKLRQEQEQAAILHFGSGIKPWHGNCEHPLRNEYLKYLEQTPWKYQAARIRQSQFWNSIWSVTCYPERVRCRFFSFPVLERERNVFGEKYQGVLKICKIPVLIKTTDYQTGRVQVRLLGLRIK